LVAGGLVVGVVVDVLGGALIHVGRGVAASACQMYFFSRVRL
jgi:hypothetical protein